MSLPDRLSSTSTRDESAPGLGRKDREVDTSADSLQGGLMQKCVIIQRDEKGYGFTVSGDNPVFVASVKQDGAAAKGGVQNGDRIVKVNGTLVTQRNHLDVVKLIKSGSYVVLTLLGKPSTSPISGLVGNPSSLPFIRDSMVGRVTAPQPVNPDKDKELWQQKVHMTRTMHEAAKEEFEKLQKQYVSKPSEKLHSQLLEKERTVKALDKQLRQLTGVVEPNVISQLPTTTSDLGSLSDSSQTSPSVSPTPDEIHIRHNGQDSKYLIGPQEIIHPEYEEEDSSEEDQLSLRLPGRLASMPVTKVNDPGPFADVKLLETKPAHMAVLLNYLISNSDPSSVLFHIISDLFSRSTGSTKELRKWAYEIFSTFIYKTAPLSISVEENIATQTDSILTSSGSKTDNENILRTMFNPARQSVQIEIADLLADFRSKKDLGMGTLYGIQNIHDNMDKVAEVKVAEELLMPHLKYFGVVENVRNMPVDKDLAIGWALATFLRSLSGAKSASITVLDRVQTFMMKDKKSIKFSISRSSRAKAVKGHQFNLQHFYVTTFCTFCGNLIWGVGYQGYQCQNCDITLHKFCADEITEQCSGKQRRRISSKLPLSAVIPNRRFSSNIQGHPQQQSTTEQISPTPSTIQSPPHTDILTQPYPKEEDSEISGLLSAHSVQSMVHRYQQLESQPGSAQGNLVESTETLSPQGTDRKDITNLNRAGSLNNKGKKTERPARRAKSDVDVDSDTFKEIHQSASSSASSLSNRSVDSPGSSSDNVHDLMRAQLEDPDLDVEPELPPLKKVIPEELLRKMKPKEKKRQEVINELFYTERAHLRNLKVLDMLFNRPMFQEKGIMAELARALFPNMEEMISLHVSLVNDMKERSQSIDLVNNVGDILLKRFDGEAGERFSKGCAEYCRNQSFALDALRKQTRKELKLQQFLQDAESNHLCRRLQLKDLVPCQMQRLTKYPLLIDNLLKYTKADSEEHMRLERTLEKCKHTLAYVNQAVKECENYHKLKEIQKRLDRRSLEGVNDPAVAELKNLDLTQHKLIFDSLLTWKLRSHRTVDLHVLLLEDLLVLLQKQDDRYVLKGQNTNVQPARDDKYTHFPVLKLQNLLARTLATEKRSFFVVNISESRAQMYEFTAASSELRVKWCKLINDKADEIKKASPAYLHGGEAGQTSQQTRVRLSGMTPNPSVQFDQTGSSATEDLYEVTDELSRRLNIVDDLRGDGDLILPNEVCVSDAVTSKASIVSFPQATLSTEVSSQQVQQPPMIHQQASLSSPDHMTQLKGMASQMNVILSNLADVINSGEEKPKLRKELQRAQHTLESLKKIKKEMTETITLPSGTCSSPGVPSDIPLTPSTNDTSAIAFSPDSVEMLQQEPEELFTATVASDLSADLSILAQQEANMLREKYGLATNTQVNISQMSTLAAEQSMTGLHSYVHHGIQEAIVGQLEDSLEHLSLCSDADEIIPVTAMETPTSGSELASEDLHIGADDEDDDDDYNDSHDVSIADLPLPDPVRICEGVPAASAHYHHNINFDESEVDSDEYETLTPRMSYQAVTHEEPPTFTSDDIQLEASLVASSAVHDSEAASTIMGATGDNGHKDADGGESPSSSSCHLLDRSAGDASAV